MAEEKKIVSHSYIFLEGGNFKCKCGKEVGVEHVMEFSDGTTKEECNSCFIFDKDAIDAGLVDDSKSFILQKAKDKKVDSDGIFHCSMIFNMMTA